MKKTSAVLDANCERSADAIGEAVSRKLLADAFYPIAHTLYAQLNWSQYKLLISFVIVELKTGALTHQDLGQLQMYVNYYDRVEKTAEDNKTIGILLCRNKNDSLVKMTLPEDNKTILAAEYKLRLPSGEQLLAEVKRAEEEFEAAQDETDAMARISGGEK